MRITMIGAGYVGLVMGACFVDFGHRVSCVEAGREQDRGTDVTYCVDAYAAAKQANALVIVTEWEQYRTLDLDRLKRVLAQPSLIDLRRIYPA
jgi:UDPglucose 6-dehydrogenase